MTTVEVNFLEHSPIGICAIDAQNRFYFANPFALQLWQKSESEVIGQRFENLATIAGTFLHQNCQIAIETQVMIKFEDYSEPLNCWFYYHIRPSNKNLILYFQDISERKQIEFEKQQLLEQERKARRRSDTAEQRCLFLSELGRLLATSVDYTTIWTTVLERVIPHLADFCLLQKLEGGSFKTVAALHREPHKQELVNALAQWYPKTAQNPESLTWQVVQSRQPILVQNLAEQASSAIQDVDMVSVYQSLQPRSAMMLPLIARGNVVGTVLFVSQEPDCHYEQVDLDFASDIAHRIAMAIYNTQLYQKVQEFNRLKTEFLSNVSHELRTPLHLIQGWAQMLNTGSAEENLMRSGMEVITRKAKELQTLIYDLLNAAHITQGQFQLNPTVVDFAALIQDVITSFNVAIAAKSIQLQFVKYPTEDTRFQVWGDREHLRQVLWHLLSNAIKFTPQNGQVAIELSLFSPTLLELKITDTGKGINREFLPYVFEQFRQADGATTRLYEGLGLGLSLAKHIVELHGGILKVRSAGEGQGTTVQLELAQLQPQR